MTERAAGSGRYRLVAWPEEFLQVETGDYAGDISRIAAELGWRPDVSLHEGIARTVAALRTASKDSAVRLKRAA
jgi:UDP-glucose 4-epimerase